MDSLAIIREFLDSRLEIAPERVLPEAKLDDLDVDSLMLAEIMFEFEDRFNRPDRRGVDPPLPPGELYAAAARQGTHQD